MFENIDKNTERIRKKNIDSTGREKRIKANAVPVRYERAAERPQGWSKLTRCPTLVGLFS